MSGTQAYADVDLLTIGQAADRLGVHPETLRRYEKRGLITPLRTVTGQRRYRLEQLDALRPKTSEDAS